MLLVSQAPSELPLQGMNAGVPTGYGGAVGDGTAVVDVSSIPRIVVKFAPPFPSELQMILVGCEPEII